jgi:hypothetical protein
MRSWLIVLLLCGCGSRTELRELEIDAGDGAPVDVPIASPDCASRVSTCPKFDLWPRKRLAELAEECFATTGRTCGEFEIRFVAPGCATAFENVSSTVSRAFLSCLGDALARERWLCLQDGGVVRAVETCI